MKEDYSTQQKKLIQEIKNNTAGIRNKATFVGMRTDYDDGEEICLTSVVFLSKSITKRITEKIIKPLAAIESDHFYYPEDFMHITVKNIRTIHNPPLFTQEDIKKVDDLFKKLIPELPSFTFDFEELALFPTGINLIGYCNSDLRRVVQALDAGLKEIGVPDDKKYFSDSVFFGNITICRLECEPGDVLKDKVQELANTYIGEVSVEKVRLLTCNAFCNPKTRRIAGSYELKKNN